MTNSGGSVGSRLNTENGGYKVTLTWIENWRTNREGEYRKEYIPGKSKSD
jgi:hypothetical protein